jgi:hypothetical protein
LSLDALKKAIFIEAGWAKEVEIVRKPVAEVKRQTGPASQIETVEKRSPLKTPQRGLACVNDRFGMPDVRFVRHSGL